MRRLLGIPRLGALFLLAGLVAGAAPPIASATLRPRFVTATAAPATARPSALVTAAIRPEQRPKAPARWIDDLDATVAGHAVSVAIGLDGQWLYRHGARRARPPASNEKLLLSMALLDRTPIWTRFRTRVGYTGARDGDRIRGTLWVLGHGDPEVDRTTMRALARAVKDAGIRKIRGRVMGSTAGFERDWWAPGWRDYFPADYIPLPTALTYEGNEDRYGRHIRDPERRAARSLTERLRALGVRVTGDPGAGVPSGRLREIASRVSAPLTTLMRSMNRASRNFYAEVIGKWLGGRVFGGAGSIAKAARAIHDFAAAHGIDVIAHDASGLSYWNRVEPEGLVDLLWFAARQPWADALRLTLPHGGQGTLEGRLRDVRVRAKTGTLDGVSALSGWVWLEKLGTWGQFSILSQGMSKTEASAIEDRIVHIVARRATA